MRQIIFGLLLCCTAGGHAQTLVVKDKRSLTPLEYVSIQCDTPALLLHTDAEGKADIGPITASATIQIYLIGYQKTITDFTQLRAAGFEVKLEPADPHLEEIVVSATRWRQNSRNVPAKIISITPAEAALQNPQNAADLLGISGKIFIQKSQQGGGSPMIRGSAANRLLYAVDGVRMNTAIFRSGNLQNVINLDPFAIERTEVLFGPGSVIYGSDAIGGVMSFQTLTPQLSSTDQVTVSGKAGARYASANQEKTGHFDVQAGWKQWAFATSFSHWDFDHLRQGAHGPEDYLKPYYVQRQNDTDVVVTQTDPLLQIPSAYSQTNLMQKVRFQPQKHLDFQYAFHFSETSPYGRYDRHHRVRNGTARYAEWDYGPQSWTMHLFQVAHSQATRFYDQLNLRAAVQAFGESRIDRNLNHPVRNTQTEKVDAYSLNVDLQKKVGRSNTLSYGMEAVLNEVASTGLLTDLTNPSQSVGASRYPNATWTSLGAYVHNEWRIGPKLNWQSGARYNFYQMQANFSNNQPFFELPFAEAQLQNGALTGSTGVVLRPAKSWVLSVNTGTAFRAPNVDDLGKIFDSEPGAVTVPNPNLRAEYAYNLDVSAAKIFGEWLKVDITGFFTRITNAMVRRDFQLNGQDSILFQGEMSQVQAIQNAAFATVYGLQLGLEYKLPAGFKFSSDINLQKGQEELDNGNRSPSRHAPPAYGISRLTYKTERLQMQVYLAWQAQRSFEDLAAEEQGKDEIYAKDANGNNYAPGWYTLNLKALYEWSPNLKISAGLENITDQRYRPYSSGISGAGRNFILALNAYF